MQLLRHIHHCPSNMRGAVVVIGNFDGVHLGHQAILQQAKKMADSLGKPCAVMTFEPHPRTFFSNGKQQFRLTPLRSKYARLQQHQVDALIVPHFHQYFANLSAEEFIHTYLHQQLQTSHVFVGYDFRFGAKRLGDAELLANTGKVLGFGVTITQAQYAPGGEPYSSTQIREHIRNHNFNAANELLGWQWQIESRVFRGQQLGRTIGFPTLNLQLGNLVRPPRGVYTAAARTANDPTWHQAVANLGVRPTVDGTQEICEAHLLHHTANWYGQRVQLRLGEFIRTEQQFDSFDTLKNQIIQDVDYAKAHPYAIT